MEPFNMAQTYEHSAPSPERDPLAQMIYDTVYSASDNLIALREEQLLPALSFYSKTDTLYVAPTGSGKTAQIAAAALLSPQTITLVFSPLIALHSSTVCRL
jgi:superfamily II DNA helicase RecQ